MSRPPIIDVRGVSKRYTLGAIGVTSLRDEVPRLWRRLRHARPSAGDASPRGEFWALRDVSLAVQAGEIVGIIGRNGAGKSTLLKILSRITQQTSGEITLRGRVASLLEVGTGFHPELSGRENVFLNGAILGMTKAEIRKKFDEIVAFAEMDEFIDTPVKRYSSGMHVRLAFAVAAHLEPEILIVDEVLAVGDAAFQQKCLGKVGDVSRHGRTVLFVSHNLPAVETLCHRAILLHGGRVIADGPAPHVVNRYVASLSTPVAATLADRADREGSGAVRLVSVTVAAADGAPVISSDSRLRIQVEYRSPAPVRRLNIILGLYTEREVGIYGIDSDATGGLPPLLPPHGFVSCTTAPLHLTSGPCVVNAAVLAAGDLVDSVRGVAQFNIEPVDFYGTGKIHGRNWMIGLIRHQWEAGSDGTSPDVPLDPPRKTCVEPILS